MRDILASFYIIIEASKSKSYLVFNYLDANVGKYFKNCLQNDK